MSRKSKRKQQKTKTSTGNWLKKFASKQKDLPQEYVKIINELFRRDNES